MAEMILCDGECGAVSPDPVTRLYEANSWLKVAAKREHGAYVDDKRIYCDECAHRVLTAMAPLDKPPPPPKPRPLISGVGLFWLAALAVAAWLIIRQVAS